MRGCDEVEQCYHVCRRDANVVTDQYARQALAPVPPTPWARKLHAFATTKGRVELGAERRQPMVQSARDLVKEVAEDTKEEIASQSATKRRSRRAAVRTRRGRPSTSKKSARCGGRARAGRRVSWRRRGRRRPRFGASQLNKVGWPTALWMRREATRTRAACEVYALLQTLGDFGDGEDAAQRGAAPADHARGRRFPFIISRGAELSRARPRVWFALEAC